MKGLARMWMALAAAGIGLLGDAGWAEQLDPPKLEGSTEFQVNTSTNGNQRTPDSAKLPGGGAVVVWATTFGTGGLRGRIINPDGDPVAADFEIPSTDSSESLFAQPSVAAGDPTGRFVVAWRRKLTGSSAPDVTGRLFVGSGDPTTQDFVVSESSEGYQGVPRVAMASNGGFLVLWTGFGNDLWGRAFDASVSPLSGDVLVQGGTETFNIKHDLAATADGKFVVSWTNYDFNARKLRVDARLVNAAGELLGLRMELSDSSEISDNSSVAVDPIDGSILDAWQQSNACRAIPVSIFGRRLNSDGVPIGGSFQISDPGITSWYPDVTDGGLAGEFVVAWETGNRSYLDTLPGTDGHGLAVNARIVRDGVPLGSSIQINEHTTGSQLDVSIGRLGSRSFLAAWSSETGPGDDLSGTKIEARRLTASEGVFADGFESEGLGSWSTTWPPE